MGRYCKKDVGLKDLERAEDGEAWWRKEEVEKNVGALEWNGMRG